MRLHIWEPTLFYFINYPVKVFQNRIVLSAVPPPVTNNPFCHGDQATAFTAAVCFVNLCNGLFENLFQTKTVLSLPPETN
jgi:hypothetical protein